MKKILTIAVTGLNAIDSPGPGISVIRALREWKEYQIKIIGLAYESLEPGIYMDNLVDKTYLIPYPSSGIHALLTRIIYIHEKENIDLIIPNFDAELYNFIKISDKLKAIGINSFLPTQEQFEARDKMNLLEFGQKNKFDVPKDVKIYKAEDIKKATETLGFPIVIKGKFYDASIVTSIDQAEKAYFRLSAKWGLPVIAQKFIEGIEINIAVLGDGTGRAVSIIPMRKMYITDKGKAWAGVTLEDKQLMNIAQKFVKATKWRGGLELEIMKTKKNKLYIMEINPRFPAWIYLTVAAKQNQPLTLAKLALGKKIRAFKNYEVGKMFIRYSWDMIADISQFQHISAYGEM